MNSNKPTTIYIVRHGESIGNTIEVYSKDHMREYGKYQSPLTPKGIVESQRLAEQLKTVQIDAIFSSDLNRAKQTAEIIAKNRDIIATTKSSIREMFMGKKYYSLTKLEKRELTKALKDLNEEEKLQHKYFPDTESGLEAVNRFMSFLHEIIPVFEGKTILVVNHGNVMRALLIYLGWANYDELPVNAIENCGYFVLETTDGKSFTVKDTNGITRYALSNED